MKRTVMLIGLGGLGRTALELLACVPEVKRIVVASRNEEYGIASCNLIRLGAISRGFSPEINFTPLDLNNEEAISETVHRETPDLIFSTATMQSPLVSFKLPPAQSASIQNAGFGVWLPVHLNLTLKLMQALHQVDFKGLTVTAPYPDVVNCILRHLNIAPTCGIGNVDMLIPKVRMLAAQHLGVTPEEVQVQMVGHHALAHHIIITVTMGRAGEEAPPYYLHVEHNGRNVTEEVDAHELLFAPLPTPMGPESNFAVAASAVRLIQALLSEKQSLLHAPAPKGLPGGYPVIASCHGIDIAPIKGLSQSEAIEINEKSHPYDGIERIEPDGTAVFVPAAVEAMSETLGYDCEQLNPIEAEERAKELISRFREYCRQHGVEL